MSTRASKRAWPGGIGERAIRPDGSVEGAGRVLVRG